MKQGDRVITGGVLVGFGLVLLGIVAYVVTDFASATALIPSLFGLLFVVAGVAGRDPARKRRSVYGLGLLGVIGLAGTTRALPDFLALVAGSDVEQSVAAIANGAMAIGCLVVIALASSYVVDERTGR